MTREDINNINKAVEDIRHSGYTSAIGDGAVNTVIAAINDGFTLCPEEEPEVSKNVDAENLKRLAASFREQGDKTAENVLISAAAAIVDFEAKYHAARRNLLKVLKGEML